MKKPLTTRRCGGSNATLTWLKPDFGGQSENRDDGMNASSWK
jgi:hypothetical protein